MEGSVVGSLKILPQHSTESPRDEPRKTSGHPGLKLGHASAHSACPYSLFRKFNDAVPITEFIQRRMRQKYNHGRLEVSMWKESVFVYWKY
jgi:hypothetical protein